MKGDLAAVPPWLVVLAVLAAIVQVTLAVIALLDLGRRPADQVVSGSKALWAVIIILLNIIGPVIYLAAGRRRPPEEPGGSAASVRPADVAEALYRRRGKRRRA